MVLTASLRKTCWRRLARRWRRLSDRRRKNNFKRDGEKDGCPPSFFVGITKVHEQVVLSGRQEVSSLQLSLNTCFSSQAHNVRTRHSPNSAVGSGFCWDRNRRFAHGNSSR